MDAVARNAVEPFRFQPIGGKACLRIARAVDAIELFLACVPHQRKTIATQPGALRLDDRQHCGGRDRRIDRIAAILQHIDGGKGCPLMGRRRSPIGAKSN